ncbi:MAG: hypothetical protein LAT64_09450 [Phycisphaerales bacterium]|nr:hypothetical protein [Planctomycetota bacterium]MCH8508973.1 hypothetical protein [Phycisphaerales bacterium]
MKSMMIAAVAGFTGLATASPFLTQVGERPTNIQSPRGGSLTLNIDLVNVESRDGFNAAVNEVFNFNLGAGAHITGLGWDVTIATVGASWLSEARVEFTDTGITTGVGITPGVGENSPGTMSFNSGGILDLVGLDLDFFLGADGNLRVEFWETFVDNPGSADAIWNGTLTVQYIPTPGALAVLGLGGLVAGRRRR